jgi:uncharacterized protein (UPF0297 family)
MGDLMSGDPARSQRVAHARLQMKKIDLGKLRQAYEG